MQILDVAFDIEEKTNTIRRMPISDFSEGEVHETEITMCSPGSTHCRSGGAPRAIETEGRNRGAKPRGEMKSNGSCVLWLFATLAVKTRYKRMKPVCVLNFTLTRDHKVLRRKIRGSSISFI